MEVQGGDMVCEEGLGVWGCNSGETTLGLGVLELNPNLYGGLDKGQSMGPVVGGCRGVPKEGWQAAWYPFAWWYGTHCVLDPSDGVFGRFDLAALGGCHTLNVCYVMLCTGVLFCPGPQAGA